MNIIIQTIYIQSRFINSIMKLICLFNVMDEYHYPNHIYIQFRLINNINQIMCTYIKPVVRRIRIQQIGTVKKEEIIKNV